MMEGTEGSWQRVPCGVEGPTDTSLLPSLGGFCAVFSFVSDMWFARCAGGLHWRDPSLPTPSTLAAIRRLPITRHAFENDQTHVLADSDNMYAIDMQTNTIGILHTTNRPSSSHGFHVQASI